MKLKSFSQFKDEQFGMIGTPLRDEFEREAA